MEQIEHVDPRLIRPNPEQPRIFFAEEALDELKESIRREGLLQPVVAKKDNGGYLLVAGERRLRAALSLGLKEIPVLIRDVATGEDLLRLALLENIHRENLNVIEQAQAYAELMARFNYTQERCAQEVCKPRSVVANLVRLLSLPELIQQDLKEGRLSYGHGKALLCLAKHEQMLDVRGLVLKRDLSVRETERLCKKIRKKGSFVSDRKEVDANLEYLATRLREMLRTKVQIRGKSSKGILEISYFSGEELERLVSLIKSSTTNTQLF